MTNQNITEALQQSLRTYHVAIYRNTLAGELVNSIGWGMTRPVAERIARDLNVALAGLGAVAFARVIGEAI